jgi:PPOX class probable F420-dependent enzyme
MTDWERDFVTQHRVAHLATLDEQGQPHVVPIVYAFDGEHIFTPIDEKPKRVGAYQLQRVRNIQANHRVAVIIDDYDEDWRKLAWVQIRGRAVILSQGGTYASGVELLSRKYPQYEDMPLTGRPLIVISLERVVSWRAA